MEQLYYEPGSKSAALQIGKSKKQKKLLTERIHLL